MDSTLFIIGIIAFVIIAVIFIRYDRRLKRNVTSIVSGMTYSEVIGILDEPCRKSDSVDGFTTCIWQQGLRRGGPRTYCTVTFKDDKVVSIIHIW